MLQKQVAIVVYYTSLNYSGIESIHSRHLLFLLDCLSFPYTSFDLNKDANPMLDSTRNTLWQNGKLVKIASKISLPQLFVNKQYIGGYNEVQYLLDSGVLQQILQGNRCCHFKRVSSCILKSMPQIFVGGKRQCTECYVKTIRYKELIIGCYPLDGTHKETWTILSELNQRQILYKILDLENPRLDLKLVDKVKATNSREVCGYIRGKFITEGNLRKAIKSAILEELVKGIRCRICGKIGCPEKFHFKVGNRDCLEIANWEEIEKTASGKGSVKQVKKVQRVTMAGTTVRLSQISLNF